MTISTSLTDTQRRARAQLYEQVAQAYITCRTLKNQYFLIRAQNVQRAGLLERNASVLQRLRERRCKENSVEQPEFEKISVKSIREKELARAAQHARQYQALATKLLKQRRAELREELLTTCRQIRLSQTIDRQSIQ